MVRGQFFSPTGLAALRSREWGAGPEVLARHAGTATELGGLAAFLATRPDWQATVLRCTSAQPGGPLTEQAFRGWLDEVLQGLASGGSGVGVHLSLQGA